MYIFSIGKWQLQKARSCNFCLKLEFGDLPDEQMSALRCSQVLLLFMLSNVISVSKDGNMKNSNNFGYEKDGRCRDSRSLTVQQKVLLLRFTQYAGIAALTDSQECVAEMLAEYDARRRILVEGRSELDVFPKSWRLGCPERISKYTWCQTVGNLGCFFLLLICGVFAPQEA